MRILSPVVFPKPLLMPTGQAQTSERAGVGAQLVGDQQFWHETLLFEQLSHQPQRRPSVTSTLDQHVENLALKCCRSPAVRKDGTRMSVEFTIVPFSNDSGQMIGIAAIMRDTTTRFE